MRSIVSFYLKIQLPKNAQILNLFSASRYHIKYMFVGDMLKVETETIIRKLRPELQMRLRFISHLSVGEIPGGQKQNATNALIVPPPINGAFDHK